jgi:hypothetical protein
MTDCFLEAEIKEVSTFTPDFNFRMLVLTTALFLNRSLLQYPTL